MSTPILSMALGTKDTIDRVDVTTANTDASGATGTGVVDVKIAGTNGSIIRNVTVAAQGTTTAGQIMFFTFDGTNRKPISFLPIPAITVTGGTPPFNGLWVPPNGILKIPTGWKLQASTYKGENFTLTCDGADN